MVTPNNKQRSYKIIVLGDSYVGKTCLQIKYTNGILANNPRANFGLDISSKVVAINGETKKLNIWDTSGQERFRAMNSNFLRGSNGIIIVYDITSRHSYDSMKSWLHECETKFGNYNDVPKVIVGNKKDMEEYRQVTTEEGEEFASQLNLPIRRSYDG